MEIIKNLEFQEKFFPEIYQSYSSDLGSFNEGEEEPFEVPSTPLRDKILIYTDDFAGVLKDVFHYIRSDEELQQYHSFHEVTILDKRVTQQEIDTFQNTCVIEMTHVYRLKHYRVSLVHKLNRKSMNAVCEVIVLKPLDLFSKRALKGVPYKDFTNMTEDQEKIAALKDYLQHFKNYYDEGKFMEDTLENKQRHLDDSIKELLDDFDSVTGLEVVNQLLSSADLLSKSQYMKFKTKILHEFQRYALSILASLIEKGAFTRNFLLVEVYLEREKALQANLRVIFDEEMIPELQESYKNNITGVDLLIQTLHGYAAKVDQVIKETVFQFKNDVLDYIGT